MILRSSPSSPFARKCIIAAHVLGLTDQIEVTRANTRDPEDPIRKENPLGKIPLLILDDGQHLYDSPVICEYLDFLAGGGKIHPDDDARWPALRLQALADGILDAAVLQIYEVRFRPEAKRHPDWVDYQQEKVDRALRHLEIEPVKMAGEPTIGDISLACALGYLDFRFEDTWRENHPGLVKWLEDFRSSVPGYDETAPHE